MTEPSTTAGELDAAGVEAAAETEWLRCRNLADRKAGKTWDDMSEQVKDAWRNGTRSALSAYFAALSAQPHRRPESETFPPTEYAHHPKMEIGWSSNSDLEEDQAIVLDIFTAVNGVMVAHDADKNLYMNGTLRPESDEAR